MFGQDRLHHGDFRARRRAQPVALLGFGNGVLHPLVVGHRHPNLDALCGRDPPLGLDVLPWRVISLRPDQAEDVTLAAVLPDQGGGETQAATGLQICRHPEHRRGQQVHLVVDDQAPVAAVEQFQMAILAFGAPGDHLIGGDGDRTDLFTFTGVLADLGFGERRPGDQFAFPLPARNGVGDQDECGCPGLGHGRRTNEGLARTARQYHHAGAASPERVDRHLLVIPEFPVGFDQPDVVCLAVDVAGQILGGPADLEQHLLDPTPLAGMHDHRIVIDPGTEHGSDLFIAQHLLEYRAIQAHQHQSVDRALDQLQPAIPGHGVDDVDQERLGHGVAGECHQRIDYLLGIVAGGAGIPQRQRGDAIGVDVFGCAFELSERRNGGPGCTGLLVVDLEQHSFVGLHDQGAVSHP